MESRRVLKPDRVAGFGFPVEGQSRPLFSGLGVDTRGVHFSTDCQGGAAARTGKGDGRIERLALAGLGILNLVRRFFNTCSPGNGIVRTRLPPGVREA